MRRCLHVAHTVLSLDAGGLEQVVLALAGAGQRLGQRVSVVCLERPGTLAPRAEALGAEVVSLDKGPGWSATALLRLREVLRQLQPDVLHTHQIGALFHAGPVARAGGSGLVVHTEHGRHYAGSSRRRWVGRLAALHARRFFCVSRDVARQAEAHRVVPRRKIAVVPNGIELAVRDDERAGAEVRRSLGIPPNAPVVGTVGRLDEVKRQDRLLRGFARLRERRPDVHLLVVGDGPLRSRLHELAGTLGLGGSAHFVGYQAHPSRFLRAMDVFALTSRSEGMPLVVLEAWAAEVPVAASQIDGLVDLVEEGRTGLLFDPDDDDALASAFYGLFEDRGLARLLAVAGRRKVEADHDVLRMAGRYARHYAEMIDDAAPDTDKPVPEPAAAFVGSAVRTDLVAIDKESVRTADPTMVTFPDNSV